MLYIERLNDMLLNNQWITKEINEEIFKKYPQKKMTKPMGHSNSNSKMEVYSYRILPQETRRISNKQPALYLKQLDKEEDQKQKKPKLLLRLVQK